MKPYDVVVVGGRVAGASTAMLLSRAGARVALLDRGRCGSDTLSTHGLMRAGVLQLHRWGVLEQVVAAGTPPVRRTVFHYEGGHSVQVSIRPTPGVDALYAPRRHLVDRLLVDAAVEAGVDVLHETAVTGLLEHRGRVSGVRAVGRRGGSVSVPAQVTVGADGVASRVAASVAAPVVRRGSAASAVLYGYFAGLPAEGYEWAYGGQAAAGLIPTNDDQTCVFVATAPATMRTLRKAGTDAAFDGLLHTAGPDVAERVRAATRTGRLHGWGGVPGRVRRPWGPGWALVGDAGYFKDPITTHGMTDAFRDAELLADALLDTLSGTVSEPVALSGYQRTRDRLSDRLFEATEEVARYDWDTERVQGLLRQVSSAMSDEVDHLQGLPDRAAGPRPATPDTASARG